VVRKPNSPPQSRAVVTPAASSAGPNSTPD